MYTLAVIVPSLRKNSLNRKLAEALEMLCREQFHFNFVNLHDIPFFNEDLENDLPASVTAMKKSVTDADGVLIVTPEYNRSFPAVLKNALDWGSRPYGKGVWTGKCVASLGMSPGAVGTAVCQAHLRSVLGFLGFVQMTRPEIYLQYTQDFFAQDGGIGTERTRSYLAAFLKEFHAWISKNKHAQGNA
ncbi:MAG: NAD(P)H-dependent oxidoreductase [Desulfovibrio sp.]|jgi:chromate reductase|nr:NAD(P)H-dependent oxidoreductase [Desulfovibrio sp.]